MGSNPIGSTNFIPVYYLYILQSETTGRFYVGQTQDVPERLAHQTKFSKPPLPLGRFLTHFLVENPLRLEAHLAHQILEARLGLH